MSILGRLALLFVVLPIVELILLIRIGQAMGVLPTLALVLATGLVGAILARAEGVRVLWTVRRELMAGRLPSQALQDGAAILVGAALLLTPGVLTDLLALSLLFPPTRRRIQAAVRQSIERRVRDGAMRVVVMGSTPWGPSGRWGGGARPDAPTGQEGLDPSKEIRIDRS